MLTIEAFNPTSEIGETCIALDKISAFFQSTNCVFISVGGKTFCLTFFKLSGSREGFSYSKGDFFQTLKYAVAGSSIPAPFHVVVKEIVIAP